MRVIGGAFKRTAIYGPGEGDKSIRPTHDRIRENVFNLLAPVIEGAVFLDLFAGCGAIGIEALSRGAARVVFVEKSRAAAGLVKKNIEKLDVSDRCTLVQADVLRFLDRPGGEKFDIVYLDPPYESGLQRQALDKLGTGKMLAEDAVVLGEHSKAPDYETAGALIMTDARKYSRRTTLSIWKLGEGTR